LWRLLDDRSRWERLLAEPELVPNVRAERHCDPCREGRVPRRWS
jgi:hypothetical protein